MKKSLFLLFLLAVGLITLYSCSKSSGTPDPDPVKGFDKTAMLANYADNLIIPGYSDMQAKMNTLQAAAELFLNAPSVTTLNALKAPYLESYLQYQRIEAFQFGPADIALLTTFLNFSGGLDYNFSTAGEFTGFSVDTLTIENNISTGTYELATISRSSFYTQGFTALEYLFFSPGALEKFADNTAARKQYVRDVLSRMKTLVDKVSSDWTTYRRVFIGNTKTDVGSPIAFLVNQLAYQMDLLKGPRIGWPLGKQSNGIIFPAKCEGYYSGISMALAIENLKNIKALYSGAESDKSISGYLKALKKETLDTDVLVQFTSTTEKLALIPDPLSASLSNAPLLVGNAYKEIQKLQTLLKADVASATGVQITFNDNDGD